MSARPDDAAANEQLTVRLRRHKKGGSGVVVSVRLDGDEFDDIAQAAEGRGDYISAYVREAAVLRARSERARG